MQVAQLARLAERHAQRVAQRAAEHVELRLALLGLLEELVQLFGVALLAVGALPHELERVFGQVGCVGRLVGRRLVGRRLVVVGWWSSVGCCDERAAVHKRQPRRDDAASAST